MVEAEKICDLETIWFNIGRLTYYTFYVEYQPTASYAQALGITTTIAAYSSESHKLRSERLESYKLRRGSRNHRHDDHGHFHKKGLKSIGDKYREFREMYRPGTRMPHFDYFGALESILTGKPMKNGKPLLRAAPSFGDSLWIAGGFFNGT